jgi:protein-tyrosine phosphatase
VIKPDIFWIPGPWRGKLAVVTRPRGGDWLEDEIGAWGRAGVDVLVSLLEADEEAQLDLLGESNAAETNGIQFMSFPIPDRDVPASMPNFLSLVARVSKALEQGKNVAVHCRQGIGRSGLTAAGILATTGIEPDTAMEIVSAARGLAVPETDNQRRWLQRLSSKPSVVSR